MTKIITVIVAFLATGLLFVPTHSTSDGIPVPKTHVEAQAMEKPVTEPIKELEAVPTPASLASCAEFTAELHKYNWNASVMLAIAKGESGCRWVTGDKHLTFQQNGRTYGYSVGFLQYRILPGREACEHTTIQQYVACNYNLWNSKTGYGHWTIYNTRAYLKHL